MPKWMDCQSAEKKVSHVRTEQFSPPLHARYCNGSKKKFSECIEKTIEKKFVNDREKKDEICVIDHR